MIRLPLHVPTRVHVSVYKFYKFFFIEKLLLILFIQFHKKIRRHPAGSKSLHYANATHTLAVELYSVAWF